jgi:hypothetical protein
MRRRIVLDLAECSEHSDEFLGDDLHAANDREFADLRGIFARVQPE